MGLDVSLYRFDDVDGFLEKKGRFLNEENELYEDFYEDVGADGYGDLTDDQKKELKDQLEELRQQYEINTWGDPIAEEWGEVQKKSQKYPDHLFEIGYWRSSYNSSGFNTIADMLTNMTLYDVVEEADNSEYYVQPDWEKAKENAEELLEKLRDAVDRVDGFQVMEVSYNSFKDLADEEITDRGKALEAFQKGMENPPSFDAWSNSEGTFLKEPISVYGLIEGKASSPLDEDQPSTYVIYKTEGDENGSDTDDADDGSGEYEWYVKAAEVMVETVDYVLEQDDPSQYVLGWSG